MCPDGHIWHSSLIDLFAKEGFVLHHSAGISLARECQFIASLGFSSGHFTHTRFALTAPMAPATG